MQATIFDHLLVLFLVVALPLWGYFDHRRYLARIREGEKGIKFIAYAKILILEWALVVALLILWVGKDRAFPELGLTLEPTLRFWIGALLAVAAIGFLVLQWMQVKRDPESRRKTREEIGELRAILPENDPESRWFGAVSITAGICEELIYRGFLIAYVSSFLGLLAGVVISSLVFGLTHSYQGPAGMVKTAGVGLAMAGLYVLTGSLLGPIVVHAIGDIASGQMGRLAFEEEPPMMPITGKVSKGNA